MSIDIIFRDGFLRVDFIRRPKGFDFSFKMLFVFRVEGALVWLEGQDFRFVEYWRVSFSHLRVRSCSSASVNRLSTVSVPYAPRASPSPWWCMGFSYFKYVFLATPYIKQP